MQVSPRHRLQELKMTTCPCQAKVTSVFPENPGCQPLLFQAPWMPLPHLWAPVFSRDHPSLLLLCQSKTVALYRDK